MRGGDNGAVEPVWRMLEKAGYREEAEKVRRRWMYARTERLAREIKCGTR